MFFLVVGRSRPNPALANAPKTRKRTARQRPSPSRSSKKTESHKTSKSRKTVKKKKTRPARPPALTGRFAVVNQGPINTAGINGLSSLYSVLAAANMGRPIADRALRAALLKRPSDLTLVRTRAAISAGRSLFAALKHQPAIQKLRQAESLLLQHVSSKTARPLLRETWTYLLLSLDAQGKTQKATAVARNLEKLTAGRQKPPKVPQALWNKYRRPKKRPAKMRSLTLETPANVTVQVDFTTVAPEKGKPKGDADLRVWKLNVDHKDHHITVEARGHRKFYTHLPAGRKPASISVVLAPLPTVSYKSLREKLAALAGASGKKWSRFLGALARKHAIDRFVTAFERNGQWIVKVFSAQRKAFVGPAAAISFPPTQKTKQKVHAWAHTVVSAVRKAQSSDEKAAARQRALKKSTRKAAAAVADPKKKPLKKKKKKTTPLWKRWYFWVAIGAVGIVTAVFALRKEESDKVEIQVYRP
jgi:hypothetical protein